MREGVEGEDWHAFVVEIVCEGIGLGYLCCRDSVRGDRVGYLCCRDGVRGDRVRVPLLSR